MLDALQIVYEEVPSNGIDKVLAAAEAEKENAGKNTQKADSCNKVASRDPISFVSGFRPCNISEIRPDPS